MKIKSFFFLLLMIVCLFNFMVMSDDGCRCDCTVNDKSGSCSKIKHVDAEDLVNLFEESKFLENSDETSFPIHGHIRNCEDDSLAITSIKNSLFDYATAEIDGRDDNGMTPIIIAIEFGCKKILEALIKMGATVTAPAHIKIEEEKFLEVSPLLYSVIKGEILCLDFLMEEGAISFNDNILDDIGNVLHVAILFGQHAMLRHLLYNFYDQTKDLVKSTNSFDLTPLMLASQIEDRESIELLHERGAGLNVENSCGRTAMHFAAENKQLKAIRLLYLLGADVETLDVDRSLPCDFVERKSNVHKLLNNLAKLRKRERITPPNFSLFPPQNLVFIGSHEIMIHLGMIKSLEQAGWLEKVKHIAGVSVNGIVASLLSLGYDYENTLRIVTHIITFLKPCESYMEDFLKVIVNKGFESFNNIFGDKFIWCEIDEIRAMLERYIYEKTKIENCTFGELSDLINKGANFRHIHLFGFEIDSSRLVHFNSMDHKWRDLIISDAIMASISNPVSMKPRKLYYKHYDGHRYAIETTSLFVEAGSMYNYLINVFDKEKYIQHGVSNEAGIIPILNRRTLGLAVTSISVYDNEIDDLEGSYEYNFKAMSKIFFGTRDLSSQIENSYDKYRVIFLHQLDIVENDNQEKIKLGERAAREFIDNNNDTALIFYANLK